MAKSQVASVLRRQTWQFRWRPRAAIILGAAAPVPRRAKTAEAMLSGKRIDENAATQAGRAALIGTTPLAKTAYKLPLFETLVRRAILKAAA